MWTVASWQIQQPALVAGMNAYHVLLRKPYNGLIKIPVHAIIKLLRLKSAHIRLVAVWVYESCSDIGQTDSESQATAGKPEIAVGTNTNTRKSTCILCEPRDQIAMCGADHLSPILLRSLYPLQSTRSSAAVGISDQQAAGLLR
jgi:hypothetical protein